MCARVLGSLELEEVREIIESDTSPLVSHGRGYGKPAYHSSLCPTTLPYPENST